MNPVIIVPESHEHWLNLRSEDVTSTEVSALFGLSPYQSEFEVWHRHKNNHIAAFQENERMVWGTRLESAIAKGIAEDQKWQIESMKSYIRIPDLKMGSSFDFFIDPDGILEIKNVDGLVFKNTWFEDEDGNIEAPPHIEVQVQYQLLITGRKYAYIGALVGGNEVKLIKRDPMPGIHKAIKKKVAEFWKSIDDGIEPKPDFEKDAAFIASLYQFAEPNKSVDPTERIDELAAKYKETSEKQKLAEKEKDAVKAELLTLIGDAEKCRGNTYSISAGVVSESEISYTRKAYRNFRIHYRKEKE